MHIILQADTLCENNESPGGEYRQTVHPYLNQVSINNGFISDQMDTHLCPYMG